MTPVFDLRQLPPLDSLASQHASTVHPAVCYILANMRQAQVYVLHHSTHTPTHRVREAVTVRHRCPFLTATSLHRHPLLLCEQRGPTTTHCCVSLHPYQQPSRNHQQQQQQHQQLPTHVAVEAPPTHPLGLGIFQCMALKQQRQHNKHKLQLVLQRAKDRSILRCRTPRLPPNGPDRHNIPAYQTPVLVPQRADGQQPRHTPMQAGRRVLSRSCIFTLPACLHPQTTAAAVACVVRTTHVHVHALMHQHTATPAQIHHQRLHQPCQLAQLTRLNYSSTWCGTVCMCGVGASAAHTHVCVCTHRTNMHTASIEVCA